MWVVSDWYSWAVWCCAGNLLAPLPVGQRRFNLTSISNCPYLKTLLLYFLWLKVSSFVCGAVLCAGVEGLAGGAVRRGGPALPQLPPVLAGSGRFQQGQCRPQPSTSGEAALRKGKRASGRKGWGKKRWETALWALLQERVEDLGARGWGEGVF